jgi:hypothetical protein
MPLCQELLDEVRALARLELALPLGELLVEHCDDGAFIGIYDAPSEQRQFEASLDGFNGVLVGVAFMK